MSDTVNTFLLWPVCLSRPHDIQVFPLRCVPHQIQHPVYVATRVQTMGCSEVRGWRLPWCSGLQPPLTGGIAPAVTRPKGSSRQPGPSRGARDELHFELLLPCEAVSTASGFPAREGRVPFLPMPVSRAGLRLLCGHSLLRLLVLRMQRCFSGIAAAFKT